MKRIIVLVLALCMCLSLFACGKSEDVKAVEEAIATIGAVTADSGKSIAAARDMYDKLSDEDKAKVENISVLTDAEAAYEETVINAVANASVGDVVTFGTYKQDRYREDGATPIEWIVLDNTDGKVLLMARYAVDCQKFDSDTNVWKDSNIREWLNGNFLSAAFSEGERSYIAETELTTTTGYNGEDPIVTTDRVFLLSANEIEMYLPGEDHDDRIADATAYAIDEGVETYGIAGHGRSCNWWLRSGYGGDAQWVGGQLGNSGEICDLSPYKQYGVRPVICFSIG